MKNEKNEQIILFTYNIIYNTWCIFNTSLDNLTTLLKQKKKYPRKNKLQAILSQF